MGVFKKDRVWLAREHLTRSPMNLETFFYHYRALNDWIPMRINFSHTSLSLIFKLPWLFILIYIYSSAIWNKSNILFFPGDDGKSYEEDFTAINNDNFWTGKIYYTLIKNNDLVYKLNVHVCVTYINFVMLN